MKKPAPCMSIGGRRFVTLRLIGDMGKRWVAGALRSLKRAGK